MKAGRRVVVIGSGAAGLAAALAAASRGADVIVLEQDDFVGGTTAISGGIVWAPAHPWISGDRAEDALAYLRELATGDVDDDLMATFTTDASRVMVELTERTSLRWQVLPDWPDYHCELPHGLPGGRSIWPQSLRVPEVVARQVRRPLEHTYGNADRPADDRVVLGGPVRGHTLVAGLFVALVELGVEVRTGARVTGLLTDRAGVAGLVVG
ncbi:MAG TPA: FAD-dependent oxidoreductase, partial [Acidimicrobiales bacterium]|nr:FAD-dependent oxidoreductase [Acidimicrobiales bacterium]